MHSAHDSQPSTIIEGTVARITYANEDNRYVVFRLTEPGKSGTTTVVGNLWPIAAGENLRLRGRWVTHRQYGDQFQADHCEVTQPSSVEGIRRYLGSGVIKGVGPVMAQRLVDAFGERTLDVITHHPERLHEISGLGRKRIEQITQAWAEQQGVREVMVFLQGYDVSPSHAARIYKAYGQQAVHIVKRDPYRLVTDIYGIGFKTADAIAQKLGMPKDAPQRVRAGVLHCLTVGAGEGHTYVPQEELLDAAYELLGGETAELRPQLDMLVERLLVIREGHGAGARCYLPELHAAEVRTARALHALRVGRSRLPDIRVEAAIDWYEQHHALTLTRAQRECVQRVALDKVLVITGGPGTGKTTILHAVTEIYRAKKMDVVLAAPTGRAANRLADVTGVPAKTIHRLLEFSPRDGDFLRSAEHPLVGDLFIIDEVSMVDLPLAAALFEALPPHAALVLVGDAEQLPSVGPGQVLRDLLVSDSVPVVRLTEIMRQKATSDIVSHAHEVQEGRIPEFAHAPHDEQGTPSSDCLWITAEEPEDVVRIICNLHERAIPRWLHCDPVEDIQVLCPVHKGVVGVSNLNTQLQALLNPRGHSLTRGTRTFRAGDKVIQLRNNYDRGVFNGDVGRIAAVHAEEHEIQVHFDSGLHVYESSDLDELALAYAVTVHKSQGSEYQSVIFPVMKQHFILLDRNLFYTALTRGKRMAVLVGTHTALEMAIGRQRAHQRYSSFAARLADSLADVVDPVAVKQLHFGSV